MPADYGRENYGDEPTTQERVSSPAESREDEHKDDGITALINSEICPGMKPGDEMVLHIDKVLDGQYQVSYAPEPEHKDEGGEGGKAEMPSGPRDSEMADMYS